MLLILFKNINIKSITIYIIIICIRFSVYHIIPNDKLYFHYTMSRKKSFYDLTKYALSCTKLPLEV